MFSVLGMFRILTIKYIKIFGFLILCIKFHINNIAGVPISNDIGVPCILIWILGWMVPEVEIYE